MTVRRSRPDEAPIPPKYESAKHHSDNQNILRTLETEMEESVARALHDKSRANVKTREVRRVFEQTLGSGHEAACFGRTTDV